MILKLPKKGRPLGIRYRQCDLGVDLPAGFVYDLKGIDYNLFPIFHPYKILYDDFVNEYVGALDDPRHSITENSFKVGELVMGYVLTDGQEIPIPDGHWHVWRWCEPARAWAHIIKIESCDTFYLDLLIRKLWLQVQYSDKFGHRGFRRVLEEADVEKRNKLLDEKKDLMNEIYKVNSSIMHRVMDNFSSGKVKPTNPQKESIVSYSGQKNKSRTSRPLEAKEGGLILP